MADAKKVEKVELQLTKEQIEELSRAFGPEFAERLKSLEVDKVAGFLRSDLVVN